MTTSNSICRIPYGKSYVYLHTRRENKGSDIWFIADKPNSLHIRNVIRDVFFLDCLQGSKNLILHGSFFSLNIDLQWKRTFIVTKNKHDLYLFHSYTLAVLVTNIQGYKNGRLGVTLIWGVGN